MMEKYLHLFRDILKNNNSIYLIISILILFIIGKKSNITFFDFSDIIKKYTSCFRKSKITICLPLNGCCKFSNYKRPHTVINSIFCAQVAADPDKAIHYHNGYKHTEDPQDIFLPICKRQKHGLHQKKHC